MQVGLVQINECGIVVCNWYHLAIKVTTVHLTAVVVQQMLVKLLSRASQIAKSAFHSNCALDHFLSHPELCLLQLRYCIDLRAVMQRQRRPTPS